MSVVGVMLNEELCDCVSTFVPAFRYNSVVRATHVSFYSHDFPRINSPYTFSDEYTVPTQLDYI